MPAVQLWCPDDNKQHGSKHHDDGGASLTNDRNPDCGQERRAERQEHRRYQGSGQPYDDHHAGDDEAE
jgi:hypothetical protein